VIYPRPHPMLGGQPGGRRVPHGKNIGGGKPHAMSLGEPSELQRNQQVPKSLIFTTPSGPYTASASTQSPAHFGGGTNTGEPSPRTLIGPGLVQLSPKLPPPGCHLVILACPATHSANNIMPISSANMNRLTHIAV
jgi:hypothetical protein